MSILKVVAVGLSVACLVSVPATAAPVLLASGQLGGSADLSGLSGVLENGLAADFLGGVGSGLAHAGGTTFLGLPDRGPNATVYDATVDNTASYVARFHTLTFDLVPNVPGAATPFTLAPTLNKTTLLYSPSPLAYGAVTPSNNSAIRFYFSGRSDNYGTGTSGDPINARFDPEGIRLSNDRKTVFVSDEYGPYIRAFDATTGQLIRTYDLPAKFDITALAPRASVEISGNTVGRTTNRGMEGLAITPDGKTLIGMMQGALRNENGINNKLLRFVMVDVATGSVKEYAYLMTTGSGVSEVVAINDHEFFVIERDGTGLGEGSNALIKHIFKFDITGAVEVSNLNAVDAANAAVTKSAMPTIDLVAALGAAGVAPADVPSKIEGLAFGEDVMFGGQLLHTLYISDDNDFLPATSGDNHFYVFGFSDADLPNFIPQSLAAAVPEPSTWGMMIFGLGMVGASMRRRNKISITYA